METEMTQPTITSEATPEQSELTTIWQEYLQKCCEAGQIMYHLDQLEGQKSQLEKNLDVAQRGAKSAAAKHRDLQTKQISKPKEETVQ